MIQLFLLILNVQASLLGRFDHDVHDTNVFKPNNISCGSCHNLELNAEKGSYQITEALKLESFKKSVQQICHDCHQSKEPLHEKAPKACFTCHTSSAHLDKIKPTNHQTNSWRFSHALQATADGISCTNCHSNSQCVKCHTGRNDLSRQNHMKSYRFFHSVEARMAPQRCDSCHSRSYCLQCHLGASGR